MRPRVGDELPALVVPVSAGVIVAGAIASRDFHPVHHDAAAARAQGAKDVFMNILTTNGYVGRFVTDWAGPAATLKAVRIRLGVPNYAGDTMTLSGSVTEVRDDGTAVVSVRGTNSLGEHVSGTVEVAW